MIHAIQHKMLGLLKGSKSFLIDEDDLVLIDAGHSGGCARNVLKMVKVLGMDPGAIDLCILTHRHRDHVGGLRALKGICDFEVASHSAEADAIERATGVGVGLRLEDGEVIPRCGGIRVIHIPGHTGGNVCLLMGDALFSGDTFFGGRRGLRPPPTIYSSDPEEALRGITKLVTYEFEAVYLSHGEDIPIGGKERLEELLRRP